ncbi:MAG TPA: DinB family protein [Fimbriimonadaceae bacterium]|nr:DinB family protein [Fimbriimonadaceae bacterium]
MNFSDSSIGELLRKGFEYDFWATMRWYNAVRLMRNQESASPVVQHILTTQRVWLERCGYPVESVPRAATRSAFEAASEAWLKLISTEPLDKMIAYKDFRGRDHERPLGEIAWHVINHGTFHRGHLRGLAQAEGFDEFADTDLIYYTDELAKNG